jgi:selenoprotein W-related protein
LASRLLGEFKQAVSALELVPSSGGCFELSLDGKLVYSKLKTGKFPDEAAMMRQVGEQLGVAH